MMKIIPLLFIALLATSCVTRTPTSNRAEDLSQRYFKRYAKKYKESLFGQHKISSIEIQRISEQSHGTSEIEAFLNFENSSVARVLITAKKNPPFGWKVQSWEMLDLR